MRHSPGRSRFIEQKRIVRNDSIINNHVKICTKFSGPVSVIRGDKYPRYLLILGVDIYRYFKIRHIFVLFCFSFIIMH